MTLFTSATRLSEVTCKRWNSMYNIWHCMYTFPYQQIWNMPVVIFMTGTEMTPKHSGCSFNKRVYTKKSNIQTHPWEANKTFLNPQFFFFFFYVSLFNCTRSNDSSVGSMHLKSVNLLKIWFFFLLTKWIFSALKPSVQLEPGLGKRSHPFD